MSHPESESRLFRAPWLYLWSILLVGLVALIDNWTGEELSFSIFYLFPLATVSWWGGLRSGLLFAVLCALTWLGADAPARDFSRAGLLAWNTSVRLGFFVVVAVLLSRIASLLRRERQSARTDHLTGLSNARWFYDFLAQELERTRRSGRPMTVAYIDLDDFKNINDELGHPTGDKVLRAAAQALSLTLRRADLVSRLGGDEFAILLPETGDGDARHVLERAVDDVRRHLQARNWPMTLSAGAVTYLRPAASIEQIIKRADGLMYRAKQLGKNQILYEIDEG